MIVPRYSKTRAEGARHTACTKLTEADSSALHYMAIERGISDYELTRRILQDYICATSTIRRTMPSCSISDISNP